ncbi:auxin-responsive protein IAA29 [Diospyros lotus]|uniref:auxin-responsive protein IAA29 n=1 Tax=Diospyros lotus TaxID=55363 RepID=UPI00224E346A|nr:auxin-responsive protein IAA29 [Diospyros lotus]
MELELGLALPSHNPTKGFDLNQNRLLEQKEIMTTTKKKMMTMMVSAGIYKRSFLQAFDDDHEDHHQYHHHHDVGAEAAPEKRKLGKFSVSWNGQQDEEDDGNGSDSDSDTISNLDEAGEESLVVGWPPVKSWRQKLLHHQPGRGGMAKDRAAGTHGWKSTYVKVKMEGVAIGRKIDLQLYHSYQTLTATLIAMFGKYEKCGGGSHGYTLTYQDKEGDWLLAGDVPWQTFVESVSRLEIVKNGG